MLRISGKTLAELAMPETCPACFKIKVKLEEQVSVSRRRLPYQIPMAGVFSNIDSHVKEVVRHYFEIHGKMPVWFPDIGGRITVIERPPGWQDFNAYFPEYDIKMTGVLDTVFKLEDGSFALGDYKTARISDTHNHLVPLYKAQLHNYMVIARQKGIFTPVSKLFLIYTEPLDYKPDNNIYKISDFDENFKLHFNVVPRPFEIEAGLTENLFKKVISIMSGPNPEGLENCSDCILRERLYKEECLVRKTGEKIDPDEIPF